MENKRPIGRPQIYEKRITVHISLPEEAKIKVDNMRGSKPLATFLGEIVCERLGVGGINA